MASAEYSYQVGNAPVTKQGNVEINPILDEMVMGGGSGTLTLYILKLSYRRYQPWNCQSLMCPQHFGTYITNNLNENNVLVCTKNVTGRQE